MNHITPEQAEVLADSSGVFDSGLEEFGEKLHALCNAAIQHYINNCTDGSLHELLRLGVAENKALQDKIANLEHSVRFAAALAQPVSVPLGWYCMNGNGGGALCDGEKDALNIAASSYVLWPHLAPYRAVQLCEYASAPTGEPE